MQIARSIVITNSYFQKDPLQVPIHSSPKHKLCVNCKHYLPPNYYGINITDKKKGFCKHSGKIHLVDGSIYYDQLENYRRYECKGEFYEEPETKDEQIIDI